MTKVDIESFEYVYGIHEGSIFDCGGIGDVVYKDIQTALELAGQIVEREQKEQDEVYTEFTYFDEVMPHKWKLIGDGHWSNGLNEVQVIELRVV